MFLGVVYVNIGGRQSNVVNYNEKYISSLNLISSKLNEIEKLNLNIDESIKDLIKALIIKQINRKVLSSEFPMIEILILDTKKYEKYFKNEHQFFVILMMIGLLINFSLNLLIKQQNIISILLNNLDINLCLGCGKIYFLY